MQSNNILLRALEKTDLDFLYQIENDNKYWHLGSIVSPFSKFVLEQYLENAHLDIYTTKQFRFIIELNNKTVGTIDLYDFDPANRKAGVGIIVTEEHQGKGIAKEALAQLIKYGKNKLNLHQMYASILVDNAVSIKLFESCGFKKCGEKQDWVLRDGNFENAFDYQLIL